MDRNTLLILGGYGNTGRFLARLLLHETDVRLVLAGRSRAKAESAALELNQTCQEQRAVGLVVDASEPSSLRHACGDVDMLVVASSTARYAREVAAAALDAGIDYLDIQYSTQKIEALKSLSGEIENAGLCFITDGGFHPGLPAALVRYAAQHFDLMEKANVGSVIKVDWASLSLPEDTLIELVEEINDFVPLIFKQGQWVKAGALDMMSYRSMDFGGAFGKQYCAPMFLEEMRSIPETYQSLKETGFYVGGFNWFVDWLVLPLAMVALRVWPRRAVKPVGRLMRWGLNTFSRPPYGTLLKLEAQGIQAGKAKALDVTLSHPDGYLFTAIPVVACLLQYLDGSIKKPGLWTQANLVEPNRLMKDMERMGVEICMVARP